MLALENIPTLGLGLNYQKSYEPLLKKPGDLIDFIELNPDTLCTWEQSNNLNSNCKNQQAHNWFLQLNKERLNAFKSFWSQDRVNMPVIAHGLSLSIGSASGWNASYLDVLDHVVNTFNLPWHSEHLGFLEIDTPEGEHLHAGTQLPMPFFQSAIDLLVPRINTLIHRYQRPFLLENTTYYLPGMDCEGMDEIDFLNTLCKKSDKGFGLLFDLYNFYCNAINFGFDPIEKLKKLDLSYIVEIHVAGGSRHKGFLLDVHSTHVPEDVWQLLEWVLPRAPNVKAVVFELLEQAYDAITEPGIMQNLERAKNIWSAYRHPVDAQRGTTQVEVNHVVA